MSLEKNSEIMSLCQSQKTYVLHGLRRKEVRLELLYVSERKII